VEQELLKDPTKLSLRFGADGVMEIRHEHYPEKNLCVVPSIGDFNKDYNDLVEMTSGGAMRSFCFQRLQLLSTSFKMHTTMNTQVETEEQSNLLGTDFYRTMKIDNHIHAAAANSAKQFVDFVRNKLKTEGDTVVLANGKTLRQVYTEAGLDTDHLTIDAFNVLADYSVYQRFDNFNDKYSPFRMADMRRIFLKTTNHIKGKYFAELLKIVLSRLENEKGHNSSAEMRLSIYGMERHEWLDLAKWLLTDWKIEDFPGNMISTDNRWIIQIPRLWRIYSKKHEARQPSFAEMLENIFIPMFDATLYPEKHPEIAEALQHIVSIDSVDDEGAAEEPISCDKPADWKSQKNPSYAWQLYYIWSNLCVLNQLRKARNLNIITFRPHAGETGDPMHLGATYMLCESINHGINLEHQVSLQYLYYLDQIGLSISTLSNNFLFRKIRDSPFPKLFRRGLNVTLSTDDPLLFHMSDDALLEEYSVARASFDLSMTDMMEIARNSILQSGFEDEFKKKWLGDNYKRGVTFCDERITHVPLIRAKYRAEHIAIEHMFVHLLAAGKGNRVLDEMKVQFGLARDAHRNCLFDNFEEVPTFPERSSL
jgi:AMP deaminase